MFLQNVFILSAYEGNQGNYAYRNVIKSSFFDTYKKYTLVENPVDADFIIFIEHHPDEDPYFFQVLRHPIYKRYGSKCYLYHDSDHNISLIPTISPSVCNSYFNKRMHHPYHYLEQISNNPYIKYEANQTDNKKYLFSFVGACRTYPEIRNRIVQLYHGDINIKDTKAFNSWELEDEKRDVYFKGYAQVLAESKFVLCPRGIGPSSYRQYESMKMGIAPVIISDEWVEPTGIDWKSCSVRIAESDINQIESILKSREKDYSKLGENALKQYQKQLSFENQFHFISDAAARLHILRKEVSIFDYLGEYVRFFQAFHFRNLLRYFKKKYIK